MKAISATILDFASPMVDSLSGDAPFEHRREALQVAVTLWNALVMEERGQAQWLAEFMAGLEKLPPAGRRVMTTFVEEMTAQRQRNHAGDMRLVGEWELLDLGGGEISLRAVAHDGSK